MSFNKKTYKKIMDIKEITSIFLFGLIVIISISISYVIARILKDNPFLYLMTGIVIGLFISSIFYLKTQTIIEEMKMKLDIYMKIMENQKE